jgi:hypothetical protein
MSRGILHFNGVLCIDLYDDTRFPPDLRDDLGDLASPHWLSFTNPANQPKNRPPSPFGRCFKKEECKFWSKRKDSIGVTFFKVSRD